MSGQAVETVLARLYSDAEFRAAFLSRPEEALRGYALEDHERQGLEAVDQAGLHFACMSYARKRDGRKKSPSRVLQKLRQQARRLWPLS